MLALVTITIAITRWLYEVSGLKDDLTTLLGVCTAGWSGLTSAALLLWHHLLRPLLLLLFTTALVAQIAATLWVLRALHRAGHESGFYWRCWHKYQDVAFALRRATPPPPVLGLIYWIVFLAFRSLDKRMAAAPAPELNLGRPLVRVIPAVAVSQTEAVRILPAVAISQTEMAGVSSIASVGWLERAANESSISNKVLVCAEWQRGFLVWCERCQQVHTC